MRFLVGGVAASAAFKYLGWTLDQAIAAFVVGCALDVVADLARGWTPTQKPPAPEVYVVNNSDHC